MNKILHSVVMVFTSLPLLVFTLWLLMESVKILIESLNCIKSKKYIYGIIGFLFSIFGTAIGLNGVYSFYKFIRYIWEGFKYGL